MSNRPIVYITKGNIERALGKDPISDYFVISEKTPFTEKVRAQFPHNVWLIEDAAMKDTADILQNPEVIKGIKEHGPQVVVFKNTTRLERIANENGIDLINPSATLANQIEDKVESFELFKNTQHLFVPGVVTELKDAQITEPSIVQFAKSHTGLGTFLFKNTDELENLKKEFPNRLVKISKYIIGDTYTTNAVIGKNGIALGSISYQITGLSPFTDNPFGTIGNDYALANTILSSEDKEKIKRIIKEIGIQLQSLGWKGLFGIDLIKETATGAWYIIEINARQSANITGEAKISKKLFPNIPTIFDAHILALQNFDIPLSLPELTTGGQLVVRPVVNQAIPAIDSIEKIAALKLTVIPNFETETGGEIMRILSDQSGFIASPDALNELSITITKILYGN